MKEIFVAVANYKDPSGTLVVEVVGAREKHVDLLQVVQEDSMARGCTGRLNHVGGDKYLDSDMDVTYTVSQTVLS